jgi:hypothetical protein
LIAIALAGDVEHRRTIVHRMSGPFMAARMGARTVSHASPVSHPDEITIPVPELQGKATGQARRA